MVYPHIISLKAPTKLTAILESRAICRYLATKYNGHGTSLMPDAKDPKAMALFDQWVSVELTDFDAFAAELVSQTLFNKSEISTPTPKL